MAAELARDGDRWVLTMRRLLRHAPERVWPMLTEPDRLARWSPFVPDRTIDATGPATARENPGDPPREDEVLTFDPPHQPPSSIASGWHICLGTLAAIEVDAQVVRVVGDAAMGYGWEKLRDAYAELWGH